MPRCVKRWKCCHLQKSTHNHPPFTKSSSRVKVLSFAVAQVMPLSANQLGATLEQPPQQYEPPWGVSGLVHTLRLVHQRRAPPPEVWSKMKQSCSTFFGTLMKSADAHGMSFSNQILHPSSSHHALPVTILPSKKNKCMHRGREYSE